MEKSAALKRLKKRCLCMVLSLLLAFGFTANEAFGFEFPPDADEPILNETEIALSEKVMNLELAVRTMKTKKKNVKVVVQPSAELEALIDEAEAEGYEIYYKFCRSVRKHSRYITWRTHEKNVYVNKQGIRGKKYYYKVRVILYVRYGNDHFKIAESELKQCRYGVRTWTK